MNHPIDMPLGTKDRLIEAAGEVFAEKGFRDAKVRDICARAGANLASVNYHFRDKESLYAAVFEHARRYEQEHYPLESFGTHGAPRDLLAAFIRRFCLRLFDAGRPNWHVKLMSREMLEPTGELDTTVERDIRPTFERLCVIVSGMTGLPPDHDVTRMCSASVIGQCLHYHHCGEVSRRLCREWQEADSFIGDVARHVTWFSTRALEGVRSDVEAGRLPASGEGEARP
ncbi:MAG: CerR family C-terminal domain-containing protein [Phycisphaeraceae bacterium]|nr:CerR family C-terminal domain-containing protein [Phycisphaerae bacterium]MBX3392798.1 CerR family C-terminal domain-containing protein [Phycisphaeraceae bacterium]